MAIYNRKRCRDLSIFRIIYALILVFPTVLVTLATTERTSDYVLRRTETAEHIPAPHSTNNNVVGYVIQTRPNIEHYESLILIIDEYVSMCEGGWNATVRIFNTLNGNSPTSNWTPKLRRMIRYKTHCSRTGSYLPIQYYVQQPSTDPAVSSYSNLMTLARETLTNEVKEKKSDVYILGTDETLVKLSHLSAYLQESQVLRAGISGDIPPFSIGFQSHRRLLRIGEKHQEGVTETELLTQDMVERYSDSPSYHRVMVKGVTYVVAEERRKQARSGRGLTGESERHDGVIHYDMQIITKSEIEKLHGENCLFVPPSMLAPPGHSSPSHCRTQRIIPVDRFFSFLVNHFYDLFPFDSSQHSLKNKTLWLPTYEVSEHLTRWPPVRNEFPP